jgi:hypothetical protein
VVCVENGSLFPPFIASRGRFRDYIWKEPAMEGSPGDDTWQLEARGVEEGVRPHPGGMGGWPIFFGRVGCFEILWLGYALHLA